MAATKKVRDRALKLCEQAKSGGWRCESPCEFCLFAAGATSDEVYPDDTEKISTPYGGKGS